MVARQAAGAEAPGRGVERDDGAVATRATVLRVVNLRRHLVRQHLLVVDPEVARRDSVGTHATDARGHQQPLPAVGVLRREDIRQLRDQLRVMLRPRLGGREARVGGQVAARDRLAERLPRALAGRAEQHPAVARRVEAAERVLAVEVGVQLRARPLACVGDEVVAVRVDVRTQHVDEDLLPLAAAVARVQPEHRRRDDDHRGVRVGVHLVRAHQPLRGEPHLIEVVAEVGRHARPGLEERAAGGRTRDRMRRRPVRAGAVRPVAVHGEVDDVRLDRPGLFVRHAQPVGHAGAVVVDDHVGLRDQPAHDLLPGLAAQVERDALLAGVRLRRADPGLPARAHRAEGVAAGLLHLDHARALVAEHRTGERRGDDRRELKHGDAFERVARRDAPVGGGLPRRPRRLGQQLLRLLAEQRVGAADARRGADEAGDRPDLAHRAQPRVIDLHHVAVQDQVGVVERLLRGDEGRGGDGAVLDEGRHPFVRAAFAHAGEHAVAQLLVRLLGPRHARPHVAFVRDDFDQVDGGEVGLEEVLEQVAELDPAPVLRLHRVVVERRHEARAHRQQVHLRELGRVHARELRVEERAQVVRQQPLQQARVHLLPAAQRPTRVQRSESAVYRGLRGGVRRHLHRREGRAVALRQPGHAQHAAGLRRDDPLIDRVARQRPLRPEAGDRGVDEAGVERGERRVVRLHRFRLAR